ncbi:MAG: competence/damage-inducible protein A [Candidatus Eiseniibacteriota bacterium]
MQVEIVTIGDEVLSGRTLDTNFAFLARALEEASVAVGWHSTVGDQAERITEGLKRALQRADAVVMTGGLGPTPDDLTRKTVAGALGRPLQLDEGVLESIRERIKRLGRKVPSSVEAQALLPRGATAWQNPQGTAPGILIEHEGKPVILLPGVPGEMEALASQFVVPYLKKRSGRASVSFTLRTYGPFETMLQEKIGTLPQRWPAATLAYLPSWFGVDLRITVEGDDDQAVNDIARRAYEDLMGVVKPVMYAEGSRGMEEVVGDLLLLKSWHIAAAESCTGGLFTKRLTDVAGSSRYVDRSFVTYSNESKLEMLGVPAETLEAHGAVSAAVAEAMAVGARRTAKVDFGVGITGIAGPEGGSNEKPVGLVFIAVADDKGSAVRKLRFTGTRAAIRERSAQAALDMTRRRLLGLSLEPVLES